MKMFEKIAVMGLIGIVMLAGSRMMGQTVTITTPANSIVRVNGAVSGTHATLPTGWTASGDIGGTGTGTVTATATTFSATIGNTPSNTVGDTMVNIYYKKKGELSTKGSAPFTVVGVQGSLSGSGGVAPFFKYIINVEAKGLPNIYTFGNVTLAFSNPELIEANPFPVQAGGNTITFSKVFNSTTDFLRPPATIVTLSCPYGPVAGRFAFGAVGVCVGAGGFTSTIN